MALQQLDLVVVNNPIHQLSTEVSELQDMPQLPVGNQAILEAIQNIIIRLQGLENRFKGIENGIIGLRTQFSYSSQNDFARSQNSIRNTGSSPLVPLVHTVTGNAIDGFPATASCALTELSSPTIRAILTALDINAAGTPTECRSRLLVAIGVVTQEI